MVLPPAEMLKRATLTDCSFVNNSGTTEFIFAQANFQGRYVARRTDKARADWS